MKPLQQRRKLREKKGEMKIGRQFVNYVFTCIKINNRNIYESTAAKTNQPNKQTHKSQTATFVKQYNPTQNGEIGYRR